MRTNFIRILIYILSTMWLCTPLAAAQSDDDTPEEYTLREELKNAGVFVFSSKIPESPALALAGLDASKVTRVSEVRKFALSLPSSFDGDTRQALALDLSPSEIFFPEDENHRTLQGYASKGAGYRLLRRTKISFAVQGGKQDEDQDKAIKSMMAIGATTSLLDSSDPRYAIGSPTGEARTACISQMNPIVSEYLNKSVYDQRTTNIVREVNSISLRLVALNDRLTSDQPPADISKEVEDLVSRTARVRKSMETFKKVRTAEKETEPGIVVPAELNAAPATFDSGNIESSLKGLFAELDEMQEITASSAYVMTDAPPKDLVLAMKKCQAAIAHSLEMGAGLDVGAAMIWRGDPGGLGDFDDGAQALWLSARKGVWKSCVRIKDNNGNPTSNCDPAAAPRYVIAGLSARASFDETVSTGDDDLKESTADTWQAWGGLEYFSDKWRAAARYGYQDTEFNEPLAQSFSKSGELWQVDGDIRLNETLWIGLSFGKAAGTVDALDGEVFKLTLKFSEPKKLNVFAR